MSEKMDEATLEALKGSIAKWEGIVAGTCEDDGAVNCPLCKKFAGENLCTGCPVFRATGYRGCAGSPYDDYCDAEEQDDEDEGRYAAMKAAAQAELDFLKSLLPVTP